MRNIFNSKPPRVTQSAQSSIFIFQPQGIEDQGQTRQAFARHGRQRRHRHRGAAGRRTPD